MRKPLQRVLACALACSMAAAAFGMVGCTAEPSSSATPPEPANTAPADAHVEPISLVTDDDPLLAFAANASMAVLNGPDAQDDGGSAESITRQNLCFSPVSLYLACTLLGAGTQGAAQEQVLSVLGVTDDAALMEESERVRQQLEETYGDVVIKVSDSVWAGEGYAFTDAFLQDVQALGAGAFTVPFGTDATDQQISDWISQQTDGLLAPDISTESGQAALLVNTLYFKDAWASQFDAAANQTAAFAAPGFSVDATYLCQEVDDSLYAEGEGFTAASLAFSGGSSITFVLPDEGIELAALIESAEDVQELLSLEMDARTVNWWLPKFQTESSLRHLVDSLKALGVTDVFSPEEPDAFAPMMATDGGEGFCVGSVQQDTRISLDENGVEAAAATSIGIMKMALAPETDPIEFKLDRPFLYHVTSPDGTVLFVGVVYNPNL